MRNLDCFNKIEFQCSRQEKVRSQQIDKSQNTNELSSKYWIASSSSQLFLESITPLKFPQRVKNHDLIQHWSSFLFVCLCLRNYPSLFFQTPCLLMLVLLLNISSDSTQKHGDLIFRSLLTLKKRGKENQFFMVVRLISVQRLNKSID